MNLKDKILNSKFVRTHKSFIDTKNGFAIVLSFILTFESIYLGASLIDVIVAYAIIYVLFYNIHLFREYMGDA